MEIGQIQALETRFGWLKWANEEGHEIWSKLGYHDAMAIYMNNLQHGDTYFMNRHFCSLVDHAMENVPDDLRFDSTWPQSRQGFCYLEQPMQVPEGLTAKTKTGEEEILDLKGVIQIAAIGWYWIPKGTSILAHHGKESSRMTLDEDALQVLCYQAMDRFRSGEKGFACWSYFTLRNGDRLIDRIRKFEDKAQQAHDSGSYAGRDAESRHEIRWVYAALYLMSQRLASNYTVPVVRAVKRRIEREHKQTPPNIIRVISLRRLEEDRKKECPSALIDWQWQWEVRGHWRNQYFPSTHEHKPVFVEAYIKGPEDKPLKEPGLKLFLARR